jgi:arylformamidase
MLPENPETPLAIPTGDWIEASRPLNPVISVWTGDRPFELDQKRHDGLVLSSFSTTCHVGTHMEAPLHLDEKAHGIDGIPLARCIGPAEVVRVPATKGVATPENLSPGWEPSTPRVLFRSDSFPIDAAVEEGFTGLSTELVHCLADRGVELVGIDTPSVDIFTADDLPAHRALIERGLTWIEGLWLGDAEPGHYLLVALPIPLEGAEAAPTRAVLKPFADNREF